MKQIDDVDTNTNDKNARQRIIETQTNVLTKRFCEIMNKYHTSVTTYRERCQRRIDGQIELGLISVYFII
jgi:hypothetical protein